MASDVKTAPRSYDGIEALLRLKGTEFYGFRSGAGMRVVRIEHYGKLIAYGEHPYAEQALRILDDDSKASRRKYDDVYGKIEERHSEGSSEASSDFDLLMMRGIKLRATADGDDFVVRTSYTITSGNFAASNVVEGRGASFSAAIEAFVKAVSEKIPALAMTADELRPSPPQFGT